MKARLVHQTYRGFTRGNDPGEAMDVGLRPKIKAWLYQMGIHGYTINDDLSIDVDDVDDIVNLNGLGLAEFPDHVKFGRIGGGFYCSYNWLRSLKGCPETVGGNFYCNSNILDSLAGCPETVGHSFNCEGNHLVSLEGCPRTVAENFYCHGNRKMFTEKEIRKLCEVGENIYL